MCFVSVFEILILLSPLIWMEHILLSENFSLLTNFIVTEKKVEILFRSGWHLSCHYVKARHKQIQEESFSLYSMLSVIRIYFSNRQANKCLTHVAKQAWSSVVQYLNCRNNSGRNITACTMTRHMLFSLEIRYKHVQHTLTSLPDTGSRNSHRMQRVTTLP
jgi:hypothetical protein